MNRREFLRALVTIPLAAKYIPPDPLSMYFSDEITFFKGARVATDLVWDKNRIDYFVTSVWQLYIDNPAACARIDGITDE